MQLPGRCSGGKGVVIDALDDWCIMPKLQDLSKVAIGAGKSHIGAALLRGAPITSGNGDRKRPHDVHDANAFLNGGSASNYPRARETWR